MKEKVIFFIGCMARGGAERVISILANQYATKEWDVSIAILLHYDVDYELDDRIKLIDLTGNTVSRIRRVPLWLKTIRKLVKEEKPDVVISFVARINVLVQIACLGLNQKIIVSERNDPRYDGRGKMTDVLTKYLYPKADKVVFQSERAKTYFNKKIQNNGVIIYNPIQVREYATEVKKKKIVSVGRLELQKNHSLLLRAFKRVLDDYPDYELWIYGKGILLEFLQSEARKLKIGDKVFFAGNVLDVHHQIADAELFVLSSDFEGLSNALMEAMMMGLPCISTDCAGSDEIIEDGYNGILTRVGDEIELSCAMCKIIADRKLAGELALHAKDTSERFEVNKVLAQWDAIISA